MADIERDSGAQRVHSAGAPAPFVSLRELNRCVADRLRAAGQPAGAGVTDVAAAAAALRSLADPGALRDAIAALRAGRQPAHRHLRRFRPGRAMGIVAAAALCAAIAVLAWYRPEFAPSIVRLGSIRTGSTLYCSDAVLRDLSGGTRPTDAWVDLTPGGKGLWEATLSDDGAVVHGWTTDGGAISRASGDAWLLYNTRDADPGALRVPVAIRAAVLLGAPQFSGVRLRLNLDPSLYLTVRPH